MGNNTLEGLDLCDTDSICTRCCQFDMAQSVRFYWQSTSFDIDSVWNEIQGLPLCDLCNNSKNYTLNLLTNGMANHAFRYTKKTPNL